MSCAETAEPMLMPFGAWTREPCSLLGAGLRRKGNGRGNFGGAPACALSSTFFDRLLIFETRHFIRII